MSTRYRIVLSCGHGHGQAGQPLVTTHYSAPSFATEDDALERAAVMAIEMGHGADDIYPVFTAGTHGPVDASTLNNLVIEVSVEPAP